MGSTTTALATFSFASAIDSFGAYSTGLDMDAVFSVNFVDGSSQSLSPKLGGNSAEFFGFMSPGSAISSITLGMTEVPPPNGAPYNWAYFVGVDGVQFSVPEPGSLALSGVAVLGAIAARAAAAGSDAGRAG